jgi:fatty-acyl-CoA synthase
MRDLAAWIERHATFTPDKAAIENADGALSYRELAGRIAQLADWLTTVQGLARGSRVAWLGWNTPDLLVLLFACAHAELICVPLNWRLTTAELEDVLRDAGATLLIVDSSCNAAGTALSHPRKVVAGSWLADVRDGVAAGQGRCALAAHQVADDTPLLLVYTSGTTGSPKGAVMSQRAVLFNALNAVHMHDMTADARILTVLPLFHVGGLNIQTLPALYCGASVYLAARFEPVPTLHVIETWRPTLTTLVPAMITALTAQPMWPRADLTALRAVATGSTDVPLATIEALHERNVPVIQIYGSTETGPVAIYQRRQEAYTTAGAIGRAGLHTEIRLIDAQGRDVADGVPGQILVRGPHLATGYWNATAQRVVPSADEWFASGDVAARDASGLYWFKDRIKHVIISGGENIYPAELERILGASTLVHEAAIAARADARWGQVPVVVAVKSRPEVSADDILALFEGCLARYKQPRAVVFVDALPRTALGKVEVARLRELLTEE